MKKQLISIALSSALLAGTAHTAYAKDQDVHSDDRNQYIGAGIGAVAGALVAGPVGFLAGGVIGSMAARHGTDAAGETPEPASVTVAETAPATTSSAAPATEHEDGQALVLAQTGEIDTAINEPENAHASVLEGILTDELRVDVFFLSGSTSVEPFYKARMQSIARLMQQLPEIDVHLEGYSDRRGDADRNLALATERLESVRAELVQAGVNAERIHLSAFGEQQFISKAGHLEAYAFDRRVEIHFEHSAPRSNSPVALVEAASAT